MQARATHSQGRSSRASSSSIERRRRAVQGVACTTQDLNIRCIQWFKMSIFGFLHSSPLRSPGKQSETVCSIAKNNQIAGRTTHQGTKTRTSDPLIFQGSSGLEAFSKHVSHG